GAHRRRRGDLPNCHTSPHKGGEAPHPPHRCARRRPRHTCAADGPLRRRPQAARAPQQVARRNCREVRRRCGGPGGSAERAQEVGGCRWNEELRIPPAARQNTSMRTNRRRMSRGFTLVEMMIVVGVIGVIASIAIPNYQKLTARSHRSEMLTTLSKVRLYFKNLHDGQGTFSIPGTRAPTESSDINPD